MENVVITTVRLDKTLLREIDDIAKEEDTDRTAILKEALSVGLAEIKIKNALTLYQEGKISLGKASEISETSIWEFLDILKARKIGIRTDEELLEEQIEKLKLE